MKYLSFLTIVIIALQIFTLQEVSAKVWYVATNGTITNSGTFDQPWSLDTALRKPSSIVKPGDTLWLRGGTYKGLFTCNLNGTAANPIWIMAFPGERPVLDAYTGLLNSVVTLTINGAYCYFMGIEITNSSPTRVSNGANASTATDIHQATGVDVFGVGDKLINCEIHDLPGNGIGYWSSSLDAEVYGCAIYYNGFTTLDRGHGPNLYVQNTDASRPKAIRNSFIFTNFSMGVQFYASANKLKGLIIDSTTIFNSGALTRPGQARRRNIVAGGETNGKTDATPDATRVDGLYIQNNVLYRDTTDNTDPAYWQYDDFRENTELGYQDETLTDKFLSFSNNHLYGDPLPMVMHKWDSGRFVHNFIYSYRANSVFNRDVLSVATGAMPFRNWDSNTYHISQPDYNTPFSGMSFAAWKSGYGIDSNSVFIQSAPTQNFVYNRRNKYNTSRFMVTVMNYQALDSVILQDDFSEFLGYSYCIFDVQNSMKKPVAKGIYSGASLALNMKLTTAAPTKGTTPVLPKHTSNTLGTFVIEFYPKAISVKNGYWNDPMVWASGKVPDYATDVELVNDIVIDKMTWCRSLQANNKSITVTAGANLFISNTGN